MPFQTYWKLAPLFAVFALAGCAANHDIAPQSTRLEKYRAGIIGRDELLSRQSALQQQQRAQLCAGSRLMQAKIRLIGALGGGYQAPAAEQKS